MTETYVTYRLWDGCSVPNNLESNGRLLGQKVRAVTVDKDALLALAESLEGMGVYPHDPDNNIAYVSVEFCESIARRIREACGEVEK